MRRRKRKSATERTCGIDEDSQTRERRQDDETLASWLKANPASSLQSLDCGHAGALPCIIKKKQSSDLAISNMRERVEKHPKYLCGRVWGWGIISLVFLFF
ncbi:Hypothetical predicted protein [Octopus vulgaris]|uniref:Uncharacterized protein n=1 Tax=Octopus vulgaris TaxID=6645 RepID=A0AA36FFB3_OCTVU|nr:Hypothetical predicted protein [Octopus vulgaris]